MTRLVSLLAILVLAAGLLAGGSGPVRAWGAQHHAQHHTALHDSTCCDQNHPGDSSTPGKAPKAHVHSVAGCLCLSGACDLTGLPARIGAPFAHGMATVLPGGENTPTAVAHAPPLPPPRA